MRLNFREAACVVRGTFNIYIFRPEWIATLLGPKDDVEISLTTDLSRPGMQFMCDAPPVAWTVRPDGIVISSEDLAADCGLRAARVLEELPLTPIVGIGNNFIFELEDCDEDSESVKRLANWFDFCDDVENAVQASLSCKVRRDKCDYSIELKRVKESRQVSLRVNSHRSVVHTETGIKAAGEFLNDREMIPELLSRIFHQEVSIQ